MNISIKEMAQNAVHFGHATDKWNPKMKSYLYGKRHGIHIFDLHQTAEHLVQALEFLSQCCPSQQNHFVCWNQATIP
ncbi:30S ribosomal protein S2 [Candidatus Peregrinibacteria bacterium]|nr:MAG: 30S ribosomal protein S2 [Candidatus Peregrinibacteria bacterium]